MADDTATADESPITFNVKAANDPKWTFTLPASTPVSELKEKLSTSEYADTPAERQRLIYSGRVLKDHDTLSTYKIKDDHTVHLVKSAASNQRQNPATTQTSSTSAPTGAAAASEAAGVPTNLAAGTGNNPLAGLTGARYAGFAQLPGAGMFGPDGGMGPPPDEDTILNMLDNPQVQSSLNEALQNPAMIDMMIQQNPMLRDMGPAARQMFESPEFRRMLTDPNSIRQMSQMQRALGIGRPGAGGAGGAFPAPGVTNTTPEENRGPQNTEGNNAAPPPPAFNPFMPPGLGAGNPFAALFGGNPTMGANPSGAATTAGGDNATQAATGSTSAGDTTTGEGQNQQNAQNPFSALMNPAMFGGPQAQTGLNPFDPQQNPLLRDPAMLSQMMQAMGGQGGAGAPGANPLAALMGGGGYGAPSPPDNRPPEERYEQQLHQLNEMGFFEFERNVAALRRSGGSVQGAVEYLLSG